MNGVSKHPALDDLMQCMIRESDLSVSEQILSMTLSWYRSESVCMYEVDHQHNRAFQICGKSCDFCACSNAVDLQGEVLEKWLDHFETADYVYLKEEQNRMMSESGKSCIVVGIRKEERICGFLCVNQPQDHLDDALFGKMAATVLYRENHVLNTHAKMMEETGKNRNERERINQSISEIYSSMYSIDLRTNQFHELYSLSSVHQHIGTSGNASEKLEHFWKVMVYPEFQEEVRQFTDLSTLPARMANQRIITKQYQSTLFYDPSKDEAPTWNQCSFIEEKRDEHGNLLSVIFVTQRINDEKISQLNETEQLKQSNASLKDLLAQEKQYTAVIGALGNAYYGLYYIDIENNTFQEVVSHDRIHHLLGEKGNARAVLKGMCDEFVRPSFHKAMLAFIDIDTIDERLGEQASISMDYEARSGGWTQCTIIPVERNQDGKIRSIICTLKWITAEKEVEIQDQIIRALSVPYDNIYIIHRDTGYVRSYRMGSYMKNTYGEDFAEARYEDNVILYVKNEVYKEDRWMFEKISTVDAIDQLLFDKQAYHFSFRVNRDNRLQYYQCQLVRPNVSGNEYIIAFRNIDEEKQAELAQQKKIEEALLAVEKANEKLREESIVSSALSKEYCSIFEIDPQKEEISLYRSDGKSLPASVVQKLLDLKDYNTVIHAYIDSFVATEDRQRLQQAMNLAVLQEKTRDDGFYTTGYRRIKDGVFSYYEMNAVRTNDRTGKPMYLLAIRDVDEETRRQLKQTVEMEQQREIIEGLGSEYYSVLLVDHHTDRVTIFRAQDDEGRAIADFFHQHDYRWEKGILGYSIQNVSSASRQEFMEKLSLSHLRKGGQDYSFTYEKMNGNDVIYLQVRVAFVHDPDGKEVAVIGTRNVDDLIRKEKMQEAALQAACEAAEAASRAKSEFLSHMSHDIRTPMNGIIGMTAIAAANIHDPQRVSDCLKKSTQAGRHLLGLINEVLDMSRIESGKVDLQEEEFNLSDLVDNLITMTGPQISQHHHQLHVSITDVTHEDVIADAMRIQKIFTNLMSNAVKYTPDGGRIHLSIREKPSGNARTGCYEIIFEDNGIGMEQDFVEHIFEPFTRSDDVSSVQGTGLGMAISRNIARMMGGDIKVESQPGKGSRFTVTLYLKLQETDPVEYERFIDLNVLVTDDDAVSLKTCCDMLNDLGMKAEGVSSGKETVKRVIDRHADNDDYFACIIDWKMPEMDGIATIRAIRKEVGNEVPIIILSAYDWSDIEKEAKEAGANAFISKPLFRSRLVRTFNSLLTDYPATDQILSVGTLEDMDLHGKTVLLVEDNELNAEIAKEILQMTGIDVRIVTDGLQAVEEMKTCRDNAYDLVFMDIQMPKMNGYEATKAIRALDRDYCRTVPIVAMTANAFAEDVQAARASGMNDHIAKPIDMKVLMSVLQKNLHTGNQ